jgi:hypothetical protein
MIKLYRFVFLIKRKLIILRSLPAKTAGPCFTGVSEWPAGKAAAPGQSSIRGAWRSGTAERADSDSQVGIGGTGDSLQAGLVGVAPVASVAVVRVVTLGAAHRAVRAGLLKEIQIFYW